MRAEWQADGGPIDGDELVAQGIHYRAVDVRESVYEPVMQALKIEHGYVEQDVVELRPETPGLDGLLAKFDGEHFHEEDEVRFVLEGEGVFDIRSRDDRWMRVVVSRGDLIIVPAGRHHRFELTEARTIRCVRLFKDPSGWVAHYRAA